MRIQSGLFSSMVMPRTKTNVSSQLVNGICKNSGDISAQVFNAKGKEILAIDKCGAAKRGVFKATIDGIPCGGPYSITLKCKDESVTVNDVYVGDLWLLAGQSNMEGNGVIHEMQDVQSPMIHAYYMNNTWGIATEPVGCLEIALAPINRMFQNGKPQKQRKRKGNLGAEPGLPFALERLKQTGIPQGLIASAHGGTHMDLWDPALLDKGDYSLYGATIGRVRKNGGRISGMLWYQGCSDATPERSPSFMQKTLNMFKALRRDLKQPDLPIVQAQLTRVINENDSNRDSWILIREAQRIMPTKDKYLLTVPTIDFTLEDRIHIDEKSQCKLGKRMAEAMQTLLGEPGALPPPITLSHITCKKYRKIGKNVITVHYGNVVPPLQSIGRPSGFASDNAGDPAAFKMTLKDSSIVLECSDFINKIGYGIGFDPYCNIYDAAGRPLPCFGIRPIVGNIQSGENPKNVLLSEPIFGDEDIEKVSYDMCKKLSYAPAAHANTLCLFPDREKYIEFNGIRFFKQKYKVESDIDFRLAMGYDGNVKIFVDGETVLTDTKAKNPIIAGSTLVKLHWAPGIHEVVCAIVMHKGGTWGISIVPECAIKDKDKIPVEIAQ